MVPKLAEFFRLSRARGKGGRKKKDSFANIRLLQEEEAQRKNSRKSQKLNVLPFNSGQLPGVGGHEHNEQHTGMQRK